MLLLFFNFLSFLVFSLNFKQSSTYLLNSHHNTESSYNVPHNFQSLCLVTLSQFSMSYFLHLIFSSLSSLFLSLMVSPHLSLWLCQHSTTVVVCKSGCCGGAWWSAPHYCHLTHTHTRCEMSSPFTQPFLGISTKNVLSDCHYELLLINLGYPQWTFSFLSFSFLNFHSLVRALSYLKEKLMDDNSNNGKLMLLLLLCPYEECSVLEPKEN